MFDEVLVILASFILISSILFRIVTVFYIRSSCIKIDMRKKYEASEILTFNA